MSQKSTLEILESIKNKINNFDLSKSKDQSTKTINKATKNNPDNNNSNSTQNMAKKPSFETENANESNQNEEINSDFLKSHQSTAGEDISSDLTSDLDDFDEEFESLDFEDLATQSPKMESDGSGQKDFTQEMSAEESQEESFLQQNDEIKNTQNDIAKDVKEYASQNSIIDELGLNDIEESQSSLGNKEQSDIEDTESQDNKSMHQELQNNNSQDLGDNNSLEDDFDLDNLDLDLDSDDMSLDNTSQDSQSKTASDDTENLMPEFQNNNNSDLDLDSNLDLDLDLEMDNNQSSANGNLNIDDLELSQDNSNQEQSFLDNSTPEDQPQNNNVNYATNNEHQLDFTNTQSINPQDLVLDNIGSSNSYSPSANQQYGQTSEFFDSGLDNKSQNNSTRELDDNPQDSTQYQANNYPNFQQDDIAQEVINQERTNQERTNQENFGQEDFDQESLNYTNQNHSTQDANQQLDNDDLFDSKNQNYQDLAETNQQIEKINNSRSNIDHNSSMIYESTLARTSKAIEKLTNAKNAVNYASKITQGNEMQQIAAQIMEPKIERWINENLPDIVEKIVTHEIKKITAKFD